jgi:hypothetical protein
MSSSKSEQERSAYAASIKRRIANMREMLGRGRTLPIANENVTGKQEGKAPSEPQPPTSRPLGTIG